jgi:hypothetical protein
VIPSGHGGFFYDRLLNPLLFLRTIYADKDRAEALLEREPWRLAGSRCDPDSSPTGRKRGAIASSRISRASAVEK